MSESLSISLSWDNKVASLDAITDQVLCSLKNLKSVHKLLSKWYFVSNAETQELVELKLDRQFIKKVIEDKYDDMYELSLTTNKGWADSFGFFIRAGSEEEYLPNGCNLTFGAPFGDPAYDPANPSISNDKCIDILKVLVGIWEPCRACITSFELEQYLESVGRKLLGVEGYVSYVRSDGVGRYGIGDGLEEKYSNGCLYYISNKFDYENKEVKSVIKSTFK